MKAPRVVTVVFLALLSLAVEWSPVAADAIRYSVTDLRGLPGSTTSVPNAINNKGQVVGASDGAFLYSDGQVSKIDGYAYLRGINDAGQIVGDRSDYTPGVINSAYGINDAGQVVGEVNGHAAMMSNGHLIDLGTLASAGVGWSEARAINASGQVVGWSNVGGSTHPFLYSDGRMIDLGLLPWSNAAGAFAINDAGWVVGGTSNGDSHPFLYKDGKLIDLGTLGGKQGTASDINSLGQIVGGTLTSLLGADAQHAFLYEDGRMLDLNSLIPHSGDLILNFATGINDRGQIIAVGVSGGQTRAYLLNPLAVPEPSSIVLFALAGVFGALMMMRRLRA